MQDKSLCVGMPETGQSQREMALAHTGSAGSHAWPGSLTRGQNKQMHLRHACKLGRVTFSTFRIPATLPEQVMAPLGSSAALPVPSRTTGSSPRHTFVNQIQQPVALLSQPVQPGFPAEHPSLCVGQLLQRKADLCPQQD